MGAVDTATNPNSNPTATGASPDNPVNNDVSVEPPIPDAPPPASARSSNSKHAH